MFELKNLFSKPCIVGLVANANEGKSNTIYWILENLQKDFNFTVYTFGLRCEFPKTIPIYSIRELEEIQNSIIIIDEMFNLFDLDNRKVKRQIENTIRLIFHNNNVLLLCGLGENFKKFLSAKLSAVIFKKTTISDLINGSNVKSIVNGYEGEEKGTTILNIPIDKAVIYDGMNYHKLNIPYLKQYDTKLNNVSIIVPKNAVKKGHKKEHFI